MTQRIGPCAKQVVTATIVTPDGERIVGTNHCLNAQDVCPRGNMPTGVGYEKCRDICQQPAHVEINAIAAAGDRARGATLYLEGHTYACMLCKSAAAGAGITEIIVGPPPQC